jgi:hypothetical protein
LSNDYGKPFKAIGTLAHKIRRSNWKAAESMRARVEK